MAVFTFDDWKNRFRQNCEQRGKLVEFNCLGDYVLQMLWQSGLEPTVQALMDGEKRPRTATTPDVIRIRPKA